MRAKLSGWLCPDGTIIECDSYRHIEICLEDEYFKTRFPKIQEIWNEAEEVHDECEKWMDEGHHAEWHRYDMARYDAQREIWRLLMKSGYMRIGSGERVIYFEGRPETIKSQYQKCKDIAESYRCKALFEPKEENCPMNRVGGRDCHE